MGEKGKEREAEKGTKIPEGLPPCLLRIDKEGKWYHEDAPIVRDDFVRFFYEHLRLNEDGVYIIEWQGRPCYVEVEDTAFVVWGVSYRDRAKDLILELSDFTQESLDPATLFVGKDNVLYCMVKDNRFPCRFSRKAYYQISQFIEERDGRFCLCLGDQVFILTVRE